MNTTIKDVKQLSIGLDISKENISVYIPINNLDLKIENNIKDLKKLLSKLKKLYKKEFNNLVFIYEPTGSYSELLKRFCSEKAIKAFIINPKRSHNFAKSTGNRSKSDKIDARLLSSAIVLAKEGEIEIPSINRVAQIIKERMAYYKFTVKQRVMANNHLESIESKDGDSLVIRSLKKELKQLKEKEEEIISSILDIIKSDEKFFQDFKNIKSIKGVGDLGAIVLLHMFIRYPNANKRQLTSLAGLEPTIYDSGTSVRKRVKISKAGSTLYRGTLFMGAMVAIQHNEELKNFYDRLKENNKHTTQAQVAVIRKIIVIAHALYKTNTTYDSKIYKRHCGSSVE